MSRKLEMEGWFWVKKLEGNGVVGAGAGQGERKGKEGAGCVVEGAEKKIQGRGGGCLGCRR